MTKMVLVHPDDQFSHRFLWRKNQSDPPTVYQWLRLNFGDKPAPGIASNAMNTLAKASQLEFPEAAKELQERTYVDDIGGSRPTAGEAKHVTTTINKVLGKGQFQIKAWHSTSQEVDQTSGERYTDWLGHKVGQARRHIRPKERLGCEKERRFHKEMVPRPTGPSMGPLWDSSPL